MLTDFQLFGVLLSGPFVHGIAGFRGARMAGMPRVSGLLRRGQQLPAAARGFSFTVAGQDSAKVGAGLVLFFFILPIGQLWSALGCPRLVSVSVISVFILIGFLLN